MVSMIVAAAGQGTRMKVTKNKVLLPLHGQPILCRTLEKLQQCTEVDEIVLVHAVIDTQALEQLQLAQRFPKLKAIVIGGQERQDSILAGLKAVSPKVSWVGVHDGARPLITSDEVATIIRAAKENQAALVAVPVKETVKLVYDGVIQKTVDRRCLWNAQTPQVFNRLILERAYANAQEHGLTATDDASLVEAIGISVTVVPGSYGNIKITTPEDLSMAEALWRDE